MEENTKMKIKELIIKAVIAACMSGTVFNRFYEYDKLACWAYTLLVLLTVYSIHIGKTGSVSSNKMKSNIVCLKDYKRGHQ